VPASRLSYGNGSGKIVISELARDASIRAVAALRFNASFQLGRAV